jgi:hypothetical protein
MILSINGIISFYVEKGGFNSLSKRYFKVIKYISNTSNYSSNKKIILKINK